MRDLSVVIRVGGDEGSEYRIAGFFSRVKTSPNFAFLWRFAKVLSAKTNLDHCNMPSTSC